MKKIESDTIIEWGIKIIPRYAPVGITNTGKVFEMGIFVNPDINMIKEFLIKVNEEHDIYVYDGWDGKYFTSDFKKCNRTNYAVRFHKEESKEKVIKAKCKRGEITETEAFTELL